MANRKYKLAQELKAANTEPTVNERLEALFKQFFEDAKKIDATIEGGWIGYDTLHFDRPFTLNLEREGGWASNRRSKVA
jgi:hypothetical protein